MLVQIVVKLNVKAGAMIISSSLVCWPGCCLRLYSPEVASRPHCSGRHRRIRCSGISLLACKRHPGQVTALTGMQGIYHVGPIALALMICWRSNGRCT